MQLDYRLVYNLCAARGELNEIEILRYTRLLRKLVMDAEKLAEWRAKCADMSITREEYALAIAYLREGRLNAAPKPKVAKAKKPKRVKGPPPSQIDLEDLINQIESL